jgi:hypothetical protein
MNQVQWNVKKSNVPRNDGLIVRMPGSLNERVRTELNRHERHDFAVNRPRAGEIRELDEESVSNFLSFGDH